ncbi:MAG: HAD family phosphatase [Alphaproteobacteria bacterium]|nr:HAD family phosphatase [Alphaproteobacteria bacterium]
MSSVIKPTAVIFDFDGTVIHHIDPTWINRLEKLDDLCHSLKSLFSSPRSEKIIIPSPAPDGQKRRLRTRRTIHRLLRWWHRHKEVEEIIEPSKGIVPLLNFLKAHNIPLGLWSNGLGQQYGHDILEYYDLEKYFSGMVFREDIRHGKPNPEGFFIALERMGIKPKPQDCIWYIGDRHKDITAAIAAQKMLACSVVPLAYRLNAKIAVLEHLHSTDYMIDSFEELQARLTTLCGPAPHTVLKPAII